MKVVLASSDLVTAYGRGMAPLWDGLVAGRTAIAPITWFADRNFASRMAGVVPEAAIDDGGRGFDTTLEPKSRVRRLLWPLVTPLREVLPPNTPLLLATTVGEIEQVERAVLGGAFPEAARPDRLLTDLQAYLGLTGPAKIVSAACASGALAVARAAAMVVAGQAAAVLVVAADGVSEFVFSGFSALLGALSPTPARPFDRDRDGLTIGEAAAWAIVARAGHALPDGLGEPQAEILGWGCASDAVHMTAPSPAGDGLRRAMVQSLAAGNVRPEQVSFICAHGTGTAHNDAMEVVAFRRFFPKPVPFFSVKGGTGHAMGAAGLVELLVTATALRHGIAPPTVGLCHPEPGGEAWLSAMPVPVPQAEYALSTNSGFGGINTAVLLGKVMP